MPTFIPALPRLSAIVRADASGELTINGTSRPLIAVDAARLRAGIIARCAAVGRQVGRPIRLSVVDVTGTYQLGIHPDAYVQILNTDGTVDDAAAEQRVVGNHRAAAAAAHNRSSTTTAPCAASNHPTTSKQARRRRDPKGSRGNDETTGLQVTPHRRASLFLLQKLD